MYDYIKKTITIKREILVNDDLIQFIDHNIRYRNLIYNRGVEYLHEIDKQNEDRDKGNKIHFSSYKFDTYYYNKYEAEGCPDHDLYLSTVSDIRMVVCMDLNVVNDKIVKKRMKGLPSKSRFHKYDKYSGSFGFYNNHNKNKRSRIKAYNNGKEIQFTIRKELGKMVLNLKESIYSQKRYKFNSKDIIMGYIVRNVNKYYINLVCEVKIRKFPNLNRKSHAGIDLGERNNIALYDGIKEPILYNLYTDKEQIYLNKLLHRIYSLQSHMSKKVKGSNSYNKTHLKLRKLYKKLYNFKIDKMYKVANNISRSYNSIIVDEFTVPIISINNKEFDNETRKRINFKLLMINSMSYFKEILPYICEKNSCIYFKALEYTTRTCSKCGHINDKLELRKRKLHCTNCNTVIDRDKNASINCYNQYDEFINQHYFMINI